MIIFFCPFSETFLSGFIVCKSVTSNRKIGFYFFYQILIKHFHAHNWIYTCKSYKLYWFIIINAFNLSFLACFWTQKLLLENGKHPINRYTGLGKLIIYNKVIPVVSITSVSEKKKAVSYESFFKNRNYLNFWGF